MMSQPKPKPLKPEPPTEAVKAARPMHDLAAAQAAHKPEQPKEAAQAARPMHDVAAAKPARPKQTPRTCALALRTIEELIVSGPGARPARSSTIQDETYADLRQRRTPPQRHRPAAVH